MRRKRKRQGTLKRTARIIAAMIAAMLIIGTLALGRYGLKKELEPAKETTTETVKPKNLTITIPEPSTRGTITIFTSDGGQYVYYGNINFNSDGKDGKQIDIELNGWLVGNYPHGTPEYTE
ncbi:MAG: hypothetical protein EOM18_02625 [Clostridia bacterium]|nr:hypothetical protein [Clostridia bacterium]